MIVLRKLRSESPSVRCPGPDEQAIYVEQLNVCSVMIPMYHVIAK